MSNIILETDRLILRKIDPEDAEAFFHILSHGDVMRYAINGPSSHEGVAKFINSTLNRYEKDGMGPWAIIEKTTNTLIGDCGLSVKDIDRIKEYDLSFRLSRKFWGKGFGSEAALGCRNYGFKKLNLDKIISIQERENKQAIKVLQKIGMVIEKETNYHHKTVLVYGINHIPGL